MRPQKKTAAWFVSILASLPATAGALFPTVRAESALTALIILPTIFTFLAEYVAEDFRLRKQQRLDFRAPNVTHVGAANAAPANWAEFLPVWPALLAKRASFVQGVLGPCGYAAASAGALRKSSKRDFRITMEERRRPPTNWFRR